MRIGVAMAFGSTPVPEIAGWAHDAEERGVDSVWLGEAWRELAVPLTAACLVTRRAQVGAGVMQIFPAHPIITALQAAGLQEASGGRFALGLGVGASFVVERWFGVPFERPLQRMREFVDVVRGALASRSGEPFSYDGECFRIRNYRMQAAATSPDVPIYIAAVGGKMLELAGEIADGVILGGIHSPEYLQEVGARVAAGGARAGRNLSDFRIHAYLISAASEDAEHARELARASLAYSTQYGHYRRRLDEEGFAAAAERIAGHVRRHEQDDALALVTDELLERFTVAGTPEECRAQATRLLGAVDEAVLTLVPFRISEADAALRVLDAASALQKVAGAAASVSSR
ncbi:MAG: LLM class flavin-dependent oxidoreductase [Actinobacteria bacterium]|nr:LLM class flavin-dependent oxidoreductase [Actinomycetota bacterium]